MIDSTTEAQPRPSLARRILVPLAKGVVSVGLLAVLLSQTDATRLWADVRTASPAWLLAALCLYLIIMLTATWRWRLLLDAQGIDVPARVLFSSYLVATFFNNFLPSNIGGDVIRIRDTARPAQSRTLATTVVLIDRGLGLIALILVAAVGATEASGQGRVPVPASWLWMGLAAGLLISAPVFLAPAAVSRVLQPLRVLHPEWVEERIARIADALHRFRARPWSLIACFAGAIAVQVIAVGFYVAIARSLAIPIPASQLAVMVPLSFVVQMLPVSLNGFGVREAAFSVYFAQLGLPLESALLLSFVGAGLIMLFSLSGAAAFLLRRSP